MAKRRKKSSSRPRRRRVSGVGKMDIGHGIMTAVGVAGGVAGGAMLQSKVLGSQSPMIQAGVCIAAGILLPTFVKSPIMQSVGAGLMAAGAIPLLRKANIISGIGADDYVVPVSISGADGDLAVVAGVDDYAMAGSDDYAMAGSDDYAMAGLGNLAVVAGMDD